MTDDIPVVLQCMKYSCTAVAIHNSVCIHTYSPCIDIHTSVPVFQPQSSVDPVGGPLCGSTLLLAKGQVDGYIWQGSKLAPAPPRGPWQVACHMGLARGLTTCGYVR